MRDRSNRRRNSSIYTTGELNRLIEGLCHPFFSDEPTMIFVDGLLRTIVEQNPTISTRKFIINNLPKLIDQLLKNLEKQS